MLTRPLCTSLLLLSACGLSELDGLMEGNGPQPGDDGGAGGADAHVEDSVRERGGETGGDASRETGGETGGDAGPDSGDRQAEAAPDVAFDQAVEADARADAADAPDGDGNTCGCKRGSCADGACTCNVGWAGSTCDRCAPGYYGLNCFPCMCSHGTCSEGLSGNGSCTCELGWVGSSCSTTGLGLYWKFDETSGGVASDSSGNNLSGTYVSTTSALPTPAPGVVPLPAMAAWDPGSLSFDKGPRQAVQIPSTGDGGATANFGLIKPVNAMTIALWYKAGPADLGVSGSDLVSLGDHYVVRLASNKLEFGKHVNPTGTNHLIVQCAYAPATDGGPPPFLNGSWHHVACVSNSVAPGMSIYLDGVPVTCDQFINSAYATNGLVYTGGGLGTDFWVGRHGNNSANYDFQGNIDEVRIYSRVLSFLEIQALAQGTHVAP